jgi:hypothetical protein
MGDVSFGAGIDLHCWGVAALAEFSDEWSFEIRVGPFFCYIVLHKVKR